MDYDENDSNIRKNGIIFMIKKILFSATGAMMSPTSLLQGLAIPGIAHLVNFRKG